MDENRFHPTDSNEYEKYKNKLRCDFKHLPAVTEYFLINNQQNKYHHGFRKELNIKRFLKKCHKMFC